MMKRVNPIPAEEGFVLVTALLIMLILTIIGIAATSNTSIELQIAGNDKVFKKTFYEAEAGAILGSEILEQNLNCETGFTKTDNTLNVADLNAKVRVFERNGDLIIWNNDPPTTAVIGDPSLADVAYPIANLGSGSEEGYLYIGGETTMQPGGALQMAAGYEGKGKAASQGGVAKIFDIYSQFNGLINSESIILFGWRHVVGMEGPCIY